MQGEVPQWTVLPAYYLPAHLLGNPLYLTSIRFLSRLLDTLLPLPQEGQPSHGPLPPPSKCLFGLDPCPEQGAGFSHVGAAGWALVLPCLTSLVKGEGAVSLMGSSLMTGFEFPHRQ